MDYFVNNLQISRKTPLDYTLLLLLFVIIVECNYINKK
jgi:hypothetical protein